MQGQGLQLQTTVFFVGYEAGGGATLTGHDNTYVGMRAGKITTSGQRNTFIGRDAGSNVSSGSDNVCIGYDAICVSSGDGDQIVIGTNVDSLAGNTFTFGNNSIGRVSNLFSTNATWTRTSDERTKKDIQDNTDLGLDFVNDLRTVTYKWKAPSEHPEEFKSYNALQTEAGHTEKMYGFIAQEVKAAMDTHNITDFNGWHVTSEDQGSQQGISYEMFIMPLVKAIQELSAKNDALEARIATLEG
ncbi:tail fiber domain-containing protein [bacterium]|nr:tail fiber domain-containing protein [bacterium]